MHGSPIGITARNVNYAYREGMQLIKNFGLKESSRAGDVLALPAPVLVTYRRPQERVLFDQERDANPFFHFFEALWMLAGRDDVHFLANFNKRMAQFSDDGETLHGAYGFRWSNHWDDDQLSSVVNMLRENPGSRRVVLTMWDPASDLGREGKDLPCNTHIYFRARGIVLDMTVMNRSNDIIWGLFGANAVHFSVLHEFIAGLSGLAVGVYYHFTNNFHAYTELFEQKYAQLTPALYDPYELGLVKPYAPFVTDARTWRQDLEAWFAARNKPRSLYSNSFFSEVADPLWWAWAHYKDQRHAEAIAILDANCCAEDWRVACVQWIHRRQRNVRQHA